MAGAIPRATDDDATSIFLASLVSHTGKVGELHPPRDSTSLTIPEGEYAAGEVAKDDTQQIIVPDGLAASLEEQGREVADFARLVRRFHANTGHYHRQYIISDIIVAATGFLATLVFLKGADGAVPLLLVKIPGNSPEIYNINNALGIGSSITINTLVNIFFGIDVFRRYVNGTPNLTAEETQALRRILGIKSCAAPGEKALVLFASLASALPFVTLTPGTSPTARFIQGAALCGDAMLHAEGMAKIIETGKSIMRTRRIKHLPVTVTPDPLRERRFLNPKNLTAYTNNLKKLTSADVNRLKDRFIAVLTRAMQNINSDCEEQRRREANGGEGSADDAPREWEIDSQDKLGVIFKLLRMNLDQTALPETDAADLEAARCLLAMEIIARVFHYAQVPDERTKSVLKEILAIIQDSETNRPEEETFKTKIKRILHQLPEEQAAELANIAWQLVAAGDDAEAPRNTEGEIRALETRILELYTTLGLDDACKRKVTDTASNIVGWIYVGGVSCAVAGYFRNVLVLTSDLIAKYITGNSIANFLITGTGGTILALPFLALVWKSAYGRGAGTVDAARNPERAIRDFTLSDHGRPKWLVLLMTFIQVIFIFVALYSSGAVVRTNAQLVGDPKGERWYTMLLNTVATLFTVVFNQLPVPVMLRSLVDKLREFFRSKSGQEDLYEERKLRKFITEVVALVSKMPNEKFVNFINQLVTTMAKAEQKRQQQAHRSDTSIVIERLATIRERIFIGLFGGTFEHTIFEEKYPTPETAETAARAETEEASLLAPQRARPGIDKQQFGLPLRPEMITFAAYWEYLRQQIAIANTPPRTFLQARGRRELGDADSIQVGDSERQALVAARRVRTVGGFADGRRSPAARGGIAGSLDRFGFGYGATRQHEMRNVSADRLHGLDV